jgi:heptaprenyl diphosphate synthase
MQQDVVVRAALILLFMVLDVMAGRRVRLLQFAVVSAGIVLFNLVIPTGRVLAAPLGLVITEGALKSGLMKATAMTGLIMLSQFSIRRNLRLPGRIGGLIGRSLFYFEAVMNERSRIDRKDIIGSMDALLLSVMNAGAPAPPGDTEPEEDADAGMNGRGLAALALIVGFNWAVFVLTLLHPRPFWGG